ncbi:hypothetical protein DM01DRAFT_1340863 [Hesseltinella vesiculosa]|uniref:Uncharacterized protein n=1 Tax=Hesseltinella vesiculosa TaxID=101127 RepID=A0A1X2G2T2_9FUNG|nr:hypothetical protein DM01DRAFT_1340863 [Hesseltinella vesiculosa]
MVESAHKSKSSTRLFNWAWPPKKWRDQQDHLPLTSDAEPSSRPWRRSADEGFRGRRRQRQLSEQDICSMNRTSIPAHHDILDFDGMIITPPRRHSESNSPHDPSSTSSSISGSRRSTKASLRDFFSRKSQSHPSTLPLPTTATPPVSPPNHSGRQRLPSPVATPLPPSIEVSEHTERPPSSLPDPLSLPQHHPSLCLISSPPIPPRSSTLPMSASISNRAPSPPPQLSLHHSPTMPALTSNPSHPAIGSHRASFTHLPPLTHHFPELYPPHPQPSTYSLPMLAADEFADPLTPPMLDDTKRFSLRQDLVRLTLDGYFKSPITSDQERNVLHIG